MLRLIHGCRRGYGDKAKTAEARRIGRRRSVLHDKICLWSSVFAQIPGGTLPPDVIRKFLTPLVIPPAMPRAASDATTDYYSIAVRQFTQQILPPPHRRTTVWSYGSTTDAFTFNYLAFTIEATAGAGPV
jgi:hypothetical protein